MSTYEIIILIITGLVIIGGILWGFIDKDDTNYDDGNMV